MEKNKIMREGWVARDSNGALWCYPDSKPHKNLGDEQWQLGNSNDEFFYVDNWVMGAPPMPDVKWEDEEPTRVKLTIEEI